MIEFGFDKLALIGAVALIVIGPEKLPKVARTIGHLVGKAQRYVADVKSEVNRSIELDELKKMKTQFEDAARDVLVALDELAARVELDDVRSCGRVVEHVREVGVREEAADGLGFEGQLTVLGEQVDLFGDLGLGDERDGHRMILRWEVGSGVYR